MLGGRTTTTGGSASRVDVRILIRNPIPPQGARLGSAEAAISSDAVPHLIAPGPLDTSLNLAILEILKCRYRGSAPDRAKEALDGSPLDCR